MDDLWRYYCDECQKNLLSEDVKIYLNALFEVFIDEVVLFKLEFDMKPFFWMNCHWQYLVARSFSSFDLYLLRLLIISNHYKFDFS